MDKNGFIYYNPLVRYVGPSSRWRGAITVEATEEGKITFLDGEEIDELNPALVSIKMLVGKTIVEVRELEGYEAMGTHTHDHKGAWPALLVCEDGTISQVAGEMAEMSFSKCPVDALLKGGVITSGQIATLEANLAKAKRTKEEIEDLKKQRIELINRLQKRLPYKELRGIVKQIKGIEDRLVSLGYKFPK